MKALKKHKDHILYLLLICTMWSCERKEPFTHEELYTGTIPLSLDWQGATPTHPTVQVHIQGTHHPDIQREITKDTLFLLEANGSAQLSLLEAEYIIAAWHDADNINFDGTSFRLTPDENGFLPEPGTLYANYDKFQVTAQQTTNVVHKLYPHTRTLSFDFKLEAQAKGRIKAIHATLSGIASAKRITDRHVDEASSGSVAWILEQKTTTDTRTGQQEVKYFCKKRLLGIQPNERQHFILTLNYTNGEQETIEKDLTSELHNFNETGEEKKDLNLSADIKFAGQADASVTIEDWKPGTDTDLDANN